MRAMEKSVVDVMALRAAKAKGQEEAFKNPTVSDPARRRRR